MLAEPGEKQQGVSMRGQIESIGNWVAGPLVSIRGLQECTHFRVALRIRYDPWLASAYVDTPSQDPVYRLFWVAAAAAASHWVPVSNTTHHWSLSILSASAQKIQKPPLLFSKLQRGAGHRPLRCLERGGFPCKDLYLGKIAPTDPTPSTHCGARHGQALLTHSQSMLPPHLSHRCIPSASPSASP